MLIACYSIGAGYWFSFQDDSIVPFLIGGSLGSLALFVAVLLAVTDLISSKNK
jgi:hypothetical protein